MNLGKTLLEKVEQDFSEATRRAAEDYISGKATAALFNGVDVDIDSMTTFQCQLGGPWNKLWLSVSDKKDASLLARTIIEGVPDQPITFRKEYDRGSPVMDTGYIEGFGRIKIEAYGSGSQCEAVYGTKETIVSWKCPEEGW